MSIAREAGFRTKIAVHSTIDGIDPIGSCVGQKGTRVMAVLSEVGQEKIDIIKWSDDAEKFVAQSLSPAKVSRVEMRPRREVRVFVPVDQLSLAIGRGGQNVRLAAKLTGWKIDVRSESAPEQAVEGGVAEAEAQLEKEKTAKEPKKSAQKPFFGLSTRIVEALTQAGYDEEKIKKITKEELTNLKGIGEKTAEKILDLVSKSE
jgi:N utilization substance protein A